MRSSSSSTSNPSAGTGFHGTGDVGQAIVNEEGVEIPSSQQVQTETSRLPLPRGSRQRSLLMHRFENAPSPGETRPQSAGPAEDEHAGEENDSEYVDNFVSRGRSQDPSHPPERCNTPVEMALVEEQKRFNASCDPVRLKEYLDASWDYVNGYKDPEEVEYLASETEHFAIPLAQSAGMEVLRGAAIEFDFLNTFSEFRNWDMETNFHVTHLLLHSAMLATNMAGNSGVCSVSTLASMAVIFSEHRHMTYLQEGKDGRKLLIHIRIDEENPARGYVLDINAPFEADDSPLPVSIHEIQLSRKNMYRTTDVQIKGPSEISEIFIHAYGEF
jgi:hypothetical protein